MDTFQVGDTVRTSLGRGVVVRVDKTTYSIELYSIELVDGRYKSETIVKVKGEIAQDYDAGVFCWPKCLS